MDSYYDVMKRKQRDDDINYPYDFGETKLFSAIVCGDVETVKYLLKQPNIKVDTCDDECDTPLHRICYSDFEEEITDDHMVCAKLWLDALCWTGGTNRYGYDAFYYACENEHVKVVKLLIEYGVDLNKKYNDYETALECAYRLDNTEVIEAIKNHKKNKKVQVMSVMYHGRTIDNRPLLRISRDNIGRLVASYVC